MAKQPTLPHSSSSPFHKQQKKNIYFPIMTNTGQLKNVFTSYDSSTCHDFGPFMTSDVCLSVCPSVWLYLPHPRLTFEERTLFVIKNELKNCIFKKFSILRFQEDYLCSSSNIYRKKWKVCPLCGTNGWNILDFLH